MKTIALYRSRKQTLHQAIILLVNFITACYLLYSFQTSGWKYDIIFGSFFLIWSLLIFWSLLTQKLLFKADEKGFTVRRAFRYPSIKWNQLVAKGDRSLSNRILLLVWKKSPDGKDCFLGLSKRSFGADNIEKITKLIESQSPELPIYTNTPKST